MNVCNVKYTIQESIDITEDLRRRYIDFYEVHNMILQEFQEKKILNEIYRLEKLLKVLKSKRTHQQYYLLTKTG